MTKQGNSVHQKFQKWLIDKKRLRIRSAYQYRIAIDRFFDSIANNKKEDIFIQEIPTLLGILKLCKTGNFVVTKEKYQRGKNLFDNFFRIYHSSVTSKDWIFKVDNSTSLESFDHLWALLKLYDQQIERAVTAFFSTYSEINIKIKSYKINRWALTLFAEFLISEKPNLKRYECDYLYGLKEEKESRSKVSGSIQKKSFYKYLVNEISEVNLICCRIVNPLYPTQKLPYEYQIKKVDQKMQIEIVMRNNKIQSHELLVLWDIDKMTLDAIRKAKGLKPNKKRYYLISDINDYMNNSGSLILKDNFLKLNGIFMEDWINVKTASFVLAGNPKNLINKGYNMYRKRLQRFREKKQVSYIRIGEKSFLYNKGQLEELYHNIKPSCVRKK